VAGLDFFALGQTSQETTYVRITSAIGVYDLGFVQLQNWILCGMAIVCNASAICALCNDDIAGLSLGAWDQGEPRRNEGDVLGVPAFSLSPGASLRFVSKEEVDIWDGLDEDSLEGRNLHKEWC